MQIIEDEWQTCFNDSINFYTIVLLIPLVHNINTLKTYKIV